MAKVMVKLLRPVMNREIGSEVEYDKADAERLAGYGAVEILGESSQAKAEPAPENKAEPAAPVNKASAPKGNKGR